MISIKTTQSTPAASIIIATTDSTTFQFTTIEKFTHNKIPSISDQSSINSESSPRSFTSMISKNGATERITTTILLILQIQIQVQNSIQYLQDQLHHHHHKLENCKSLMGLGLVQELYYMIPIMKMNMIDILILLHVIN